MTLHQLEIWIAVAKHKNVTKTADELHVRQPSVSQQIKSLEREYGIKLYNNYARRGIELDQCRRIIDARPVHEVRQRVVAAVADLQHVQPVVDEVLF